MSFDSSSRETTASSSDTSTTSTSRRRMETLSQCLHRTINIGAPLYNDGKVKECYDLYLETARYVVESSETIQKSAVGQRLETSIAEATQVVAQEAASNGDAEQGGYNEGAWILRRCFDGILEASDPSSRALKQRQASILVVPGGALDDIDQCENVIGGDDDVGVDYSEELSSEERSYWQSEPALNTTDHERGQALADVAYILRSSITPAEHSRVLSTGTANGGGSSSLLGRLAPKKTFMDCFPASQAVETLTSLGLAANRKMATEKLQHLWQAGFVKSVSHPSESNFQDGTRLYRFPSVQELQQSMERIMEKENPPLIGSDESVYLIALRTTLDLPSLEASSSSSATEEQAQQEEQEKRSILQDHSISRRANSKKYWTMSSRALDSRGPHPSIVHTPEHLRGQEIADLAASLESIIDIRDRKYKFKTYSNCFVGQEAVDEIVAAKGETKTVISREQAVQRLSDLVHYGLVHHVTRDHLFKDKYLFYRFTSLQDIKNSINAMASLPVEPVGNDMIRFTALIHRYKQYTSLDIESILNSFFGTDTKEGWDCDDLENWRNNMKRWGFGRREDQDDDMVQTLAPLLTNIDPETWTPVPEKENDIDESDGDAIIDKEEWESPYGILAQIALFDQIPRSAFRGTPDAFKWDRLAIRATYTALEKGYFETAYKSTLNQFLLLLPLEHSESWEDQKLGVRLLLQLLSTVAVQDNDAGRTDYEIVKRLEFSKRLTTAFLEHAQVIAKFKRYPHRNKALGRNTTLEERIWLASDLVPRWAKSQNPEDARNVIQLPVIPLKRLTKR